MSRCGKPRSRTSVYAPSALPRAPRLACNSASKAPRTRIFAAQYHVALRQASVTYVRVRSLGSSSRSSSCLQLCVKSTAYPHICCAIPCRAAASLGHVRPCTLPRLFLALLVLLATLRQKHRVPAYLLRNTMSRCGKPRSRTSVYAPSALPRAPRLACNSASKAPRTCIFAAQYHVSAKL